MLWYPSYPGTLSLPRTMSSFGNDLKPPTSMSDICFGSSNCTDLSQACQKGLETSTGPFALRFYRNEMMLEGWHLLRTTRTL
jgi:hypothetical protein